MESTREKERESDTKIASDPIRECHSWYRNTLMATGIRKMNGCWNLDPIREGFYKLL
jgi:hypothetical protein